MKGAYEKKPIYRNELKQYINIGDYIILRNRLEVICSKDKHAQRSGKYKIRSLYFETPDDKALREKLDGVNNREKFRLRYYDDDFSFIKLEKNQSRMGMAIKSRHRDKRGMRKNHKRGYRMDEEEREGTSA